MGHGEWFLLFLLIWTCLNPMREPPFSTVLGRVILWMAIALNFVLWIADSIHP